MTIGNARYVAGELGPVAARGLGDDIAGRLRDAVAFGRFEPGQHLTEKELSDAFGVSRGPVREALAQLDREGLVSLRRNRGAVVRGLTDRDIEEVYGLRVVLERFAVEHAISRVTPEDLRAMDAVVEAMTVAAATEGSQQLVAELDVEFHDLIYRAARHQRLMSSWTNLRSQVYVFILSRNVHNDDYRAIAVGEHRALRNLLEQGDQARALEGIEAHLRGAYERLIRAGEDRPAR